MREEFVVPAQITGSIRLLNCYNRTIDFTMDEKDLIRGRLGLALSD